MLRKLVVVIAIGWGSGCAPARPVVHSAGNSPAVQQQCSGTIDVPTGLRVIESDLQTQFVRPPTQGYLCAARTVVALDATTTVYRLWGGSAGRFGRFWTFAPPATSQTFREQYGVCSEWNPLQTLTQCEIASGTTAVIGTGQSVHCPTSNVDYPASSMLQIVIPDAQQHLVNCVDRPFSP